MPRERQEITHDLRIGLPIEAVALDGPRSTGLVEERALDRPAPGAVGPQERPIDVEQNELHAENIIDIEGTRSEEHTSELQSRLHLVCRLLLEKKKHKEEINIQDDIS